MVVGIRCRCMALLMCLPVLLRSPPEEDYRPGQQSEDDDASDDPTSDSTYRGSFTVRARRR